MMHRNIEVGIDDTDHIGFFCDCGHNVNSTAEKDSQQL